jgi:hypothetical protein
VFYRRILVKTRVIRVRLLRMNSTIIVGGGLEGLLTANILRKRGEDFLGLEKSSRLSSEFDLYRLYDPATVAFIRDLCPEAEWIEIGDSAKERKKGEWHDVEQVTSKDGHYTLGTKFFMPRLGATQWIETLAEPVSAFFKPNTEGTELFPDEKKLICRDGSELYYTKLYWCLSLHELAKIWKGEKTVLEKRIRKLGKNPPVIHWDLELTEPFLPWKNSVALPIRHKDHKLQAIGNEDNELHWFISIDRDDAEDREEVAKYVRTLKREIFKELPELKDKIKKEKIVFSTETAGENVVPSDTLELASGLFYVGSELGLSDEERELLHLDRMVKNCIHLQSTLA